MSPFTSNFTKVHLKILLGFVVAFTWLSIWWLSQQSTGDQRDNWNVATVILTWTGPFAGAIARHLQSCCFKFSLSLLPFCAAFLLGGVVCQIVALPLEHGQRGFRLVTWTVGLLGWFAGAPISFLHALS
jgi:hypothetical protein